MGVVGGGIRISGCFAYLASERYVAEVVLPVHFMLVSDDSVVCCNALGQ